LGAALQENEWVQGEEGRQVGASLYAQRQLFFTTLRGKAAKGLGTKPECPIISITRYAREIAQLQIQGGANIC